MNILIIEDDKAVANNLVQGFAEKGIQASVAYDGVDGLACALNEEYDVIVIDRMLPGLDGLTIIRQLRSQHNYTPTIMLTALAEVDDKVEGLEAGSDDYLAKPFEFAELLARVKALAKRGKNAELANTTITVGELCIDKLKREATLADQKLSLQPREFDLLVFFANHVGEVVTRQMLLQSVWGYNFDPQTNIVDVHISRLRNKVEGHQKDPLIKTIRGIGYVFNIDTSKHSSNR